MIKIRKLLFLSILLLLFCIGCTSKEPAKYYLRVGNMVPIIEVSEEDNNVLKELVKHYTSDKVIPEKYGATGGINIFIVDSNTLVSYKNSDGLIAISKNGEDSYYVYKEITEGIRDTEILVDMVDKYFPMLVSVNYYDDSYGEIIDHSNDSTITIGSSDITKREKENIFLLSGLTNYIISCGIHDNDAVVDSYNEETAIYSIHISNTKTDFYFTITENYLLFDEKAYCIKQELIDFIEEIANAKLT